MFSRILAFVACAFFCVNSALVAQPAVGEGMTGTFQNKTIPVTLEATDPQVSALVRKAFNAHGAYRLEAGATTRIVFSKTSDTAITVTCNLPGAQATQQVSGANWIDTTLRACDAAVVLTGKSQGLRPLFTGRLAFVSDRTGKKEVYSSDLFLEAVRPLTDLKSISITPSWTRDGAEVLFTTYHNNNFTDIYAVNVASRQLRDVVVGVRGTSTGAVSNPADGRLAFASSSRGNMDIYLADSAGRGAKALVATDGVESDATWSPDGRQLAFTSGPNGRPSIYTVGASGGAPTRIATPGYSYATEPSWNPVDPQKIAFTYQQGGAFGVAVVNLSTREIKLASKGGSFMHPVWCADGRHLVATRLAGRAARLVLIDSESGKATELSGTQMANCSEPDYWVAR